MLLIEGADETAALDAEQRNRLGVLRLRAAYDNLLDTAVTADNAIAVTEEEAPRAKRRDDMHVGCSISDKLGVIVFKILARSNPFWQAGWVGAERES